MFSITGNSRDFSLEDRIFIISTFTTTIFGIVAIGINLFSELPFYENVLSFGYIVFSATLFYRARFRHKVNALIYLISTQIFLSLIWFVNGGLISSVPYVFFVMLFIALVVVKIKRVYTFTLVLGHLSFLICLEYFKPEWVIHYSSRTNQFFDMAFTLPAIMLLLATWLIMLKKNYDDERDMLEKTRENLILSEKISSAGMLAGNIAHEMNSPIGAIMTSAQYLEVLLDDIDDKDLRKELSESLDVIERSSKKSKEIIAKLLRVTTREEKRFERVNLHILVKNIIGEFFIKYAEDKIRIIYNRKNELYIDGNSDEILTVFKNIIDNSYDALIKSKNNKKEIEIEIREEKNRITIKIKDNGIGIEEEEEEVAKVFDPFYTTKLNDGNTGLGLTVVHNLIEKHGWNIKLDSVKDKGTTIFIEIPINYKRKITLE